VRFEPASTKVARRAVYHGRDGMRAYLADVDTTWQQFELSIAEVREQPPLVIVLGRVYARAAGFIADNPIGFVWEVGADGLVRWGRTFSERAAAVQFALDYARCEPPS
jgi:hypothetical protein